ncbi:mediator of RNA polymerase II transcription subunit 13 [Trichoderma asperellum]|uniref:Mediator of RNA polymerase II transcription subunit 13 n=1 Tax=Trichoderma asperellum TaxID=101201 RepID=A0A6V8QQU0_TRIAP|nr:mediator of RNA polymerase II transcription subunit 13 [Trichoderma asperellum]
MAKARVVDTVLSGHEESHDPLGNAKGWHSSMTEREEKIKRVMERAATMPKDSHPQPADSKTPKLSGLSPVALQRPNTATAGIMYPTPPDGIQQPNGVTPSMDGTFSSPGNPLSAPIMPEADVALQNEPAGGDGLDQSPNVTEPKRRRSDNNLLGDTDNMLGGDVGGDMFDDNDITEADFNFFDEKPGDLDVDIAMSDLPSSEMAPSQAAEEPIRPVEAMQQPLAPTPVSLPPAPSLPPSTPTPVPAVSPTSAPAPALPAAIPLPPPPPPPPPQKETVVFAKPELKHARSQNEDAARRNRDIRVTPAKRESSPFDPHAVFKRVKASLKIPKYDSSISSQHPWRKAKVFESLDFDPAIPMISKKYEQGGFFDLSALSKVERMEKANGDVRAVPETDYLKRHDMGLTDEDVIQIAQIVTEQAATGSLDIFNASDFEPATLSASEKRSDLSIHARDAFYTLEGIMMHFFEDAMPVRLKGLLDIQDLPILTVPFWESLGLSPSSGSKNINAICVFPGWSGMGDNVKAFMDRVKSVYELLKLGTFEVMPLGEDVEAGLLPYEVDRITTSPDATVTRHGSAMVECMEALRGVFNSLTITETNFVIYFVYSPENPGTIIESCTAFQRFYELYQKILASRKEPPQNELVLQLVSTDLLSSPSALVITQTSDLVRLCIETYDRCTLFGGPMPAPAIRLEQLLPRIIDFKLTTNPSASLIRENSCIHVAYSQSVDERWVTAAWTDDRGNQQATAAYCMGRKGKPPSRNMTEIANEIWETTLELISSWNVLWRVIITKCGPMPQHEVDFWVDLARTEIHAKVTLVLLTVDSSPSLQLLPPAIKLPAPTAALHTPVSTPQPSIQSPEPVATPATPAANATAATPNDGAAAGAGDADSDDILVDVTDQTWGAIAGHRLSNSTSILEVQLSLMSGYLIKRTGLRLEDPPIVMEVNLIYTEATPRVHEPLLREMLGYFRGLGTLARARGVVDKEGDVRPWHVAAAEKAVRALYLLM